MNRGWHKTSPDVGNKGKVSERGVVAVVVQRLYSALLDVRDVGSYTQKSSEVELSSSIFQP